MRTSLLFLCVLSAACGDSVASVGNNTFAAEEEVASTSDALLSNSAKTWFPMQEGNTWTFASASGATRTLSFSDVWDGMGWLDGVSRDGAWAGLSSAAPNTLYAWSYDLQQWEPLFRFGYQYTPWTIGQGCDKFTLTRTATDASAVVPAGSFTGVRTISFSPNPPPTALCHVPLYKSITFAPGVGPVMFLSGSGEKFTLQGAVVAGKRYPVAPPAAITSKLTFDKLSYVNRSNTIVCITTPCPGNAVTAVAKYTYTITNGTSAEQVWQFSTGCQHDLTLTDAGGKVLRAASEGRICTSALSNITLAPGATKTISGSIDLADAQGTQLSGTLSAKAFLTPRLGAQAMQVAPATASVAVSIQPAVP